MTHSISRPSGPYIPPKPGSKEKNPATEKKIESWSSPVFSGTLCLVVER